VEVFLVLGAGLLCASMARKRGRRPVVWFFLGVFFNIAAVIILFFLKPRSGSPLDVQLYDPPPSPTFSQSTTTAHRGGGGQAQRGSQLGHVDLNALRAAVTSGHGQQVNGGQGRDGSLDPILEPGSRSEFLRLVEQVAPTLDFAPLPAATQQRLRDSWLEMGRMFVRSGEAGGVTDSCEFYQFDGDREELPVLFYPLALDDPDHTIVVQFACSVKRFLRASDELMEWIENRADGEFPDVTWSYDEDSQNFFLFVAGLVNPSQTPVDEETLGEWCRIVREDALAVKRDLPTKFGGIWV